MNAHESSKEKKNDTETTELCWICQRTTLACQRKKLENELEVTALTSCRISKGEGLADELEIELNATADRISLRKNDADGENQGKVGNSVHGADDITA
ncbi:hypothetical protein V6N13_082949 [Hibiscus sabdariffa]